MILFKFPSPASLRTQSWEETPAAKASKDAMSAGQPQHDQPYCTLFSLEQIKVLQEAFDSNMFPSQEESQELASRLQLKELVVKMWFRNQRDKFKTQQQNHQWRSPVAASSQAKVVRRAPSKQATREKGASSNQAPREMGAPSNQASREIDASSNQAKTVRRALTNQAKRLRKESSNQVKSVRSPSSKVAVIEMGASSNQAPKEMGTLSNHTPRDMDPPSSQAPREMDASSNQVKRVRKESSNQVKSVKRASSKQALREMGASSNQAPREMSAPSNQALKEMDVSSNQAKTMRGAPSKQVTSRKDDDVLVVKADYAQLLSTRDLDNSELESWENFGANQPEDSTSEWKYVEHPELLGIHESLGLVQPPWVSMAFDIDTLVKMYDLPGDDDPQDFDKYL